MYVMYIHYVIYIFLINHKDKYIIIYNVYNNINM